MRVDEALVSRGLADSIESARALIAADCVRIDGKPVTNPARTITAKAQLVVKAARKYVSRAGEKLEAALDHWGVDPSGDVWIDIGASTGGFTDCLLTRGAAHVHAVDIGRGLLDPKLLQDARVNSWEGVHADSIGSLTLDPRADHACIDVSFIGLDRILPAVRAALGPIPTLALYKPQFECGRDEPGFRGVVRDPDTVIAHLPEFCARWTGPDAWASIQVVVSALRGRDGNVEFWIALGIASDHSNQDLPGLIRAAYAEP